MSPRGRGGFATPLAVCFLAALGGIAATSFYTVVEARRGATRFARREEAAATADVGLFAALDRWSADARDSLPIGGTDSGAAHVTRLTDRLYSVTAAGRVATGTAVEAARTHNLLVEVLRPRVSVGAAITSAGAVVAGPDVLIEGSDAHPPGWSDCPPADTSAAPAVFASADSGIYTRLGRVTTAALAARADITLPAGAIVSPHPDLQADCEAAGPEAGARDWGEPARTGRSVRCERRFPVVHAVAGLDVRSGRGQGVLVVTGDLRIRGPFVFYGVVIVAGQIEVSGSDVTVYGAVFSADRRGVVWEAAGQVRRSSCAVSKASDAARRPYPIPLRAWAELF